MSLPYQEVAGCTGFGEMSTFVREIKNGHVSWFQTITRKNSGQGTVNSGQWIERQLHDLLQTDDANGNARRSGGRSFDYCFKYGRFEQLIHNGAELFCIEDKGVTKYFSNCLLTKDFHSFFHRGGLRGSRFPTLSAKTKTR